MKKVLTIVLITSMAVAFIFIGLLVINENHIIKFPYEIRSNFILNLYYGIVPIFLLIIFSTVSIKSIITKSFKWTRWLSFIVVIIFMIPLVMITFEKGILGTFEKLMVLLFGLIFTGILALLLVIKKRKWTKWLCFSLFIILAFLSVFGIVDSYESKRQVYTDDYVRMVKEENPKFKIVEQIKVRMYSQDTRERFIKETWFFIRYSKPYTLESLNGIWKGYDRLGNLATYNVYENGNIISSLPIIRENEKYISDLDTLLSVLKSKEEGKIYVLDGEFKLKRQLHIRNKEGISFYKSINKSNPEFSSDKNSNIALVLENCSNLVFDGINFNLNNTSGETAGIISIINCNNIIIRNCTISGRSKYGIFVDKKSKNINISNNRITSYRSFAIAVNNDNVRCDDNSYFRFERNDNYRNLLINDFNFNTSVVKKIIARALVNSEEYAFHTGTETIKAGDKKIGMFMGGLTSLYYNVGLHTALDNFFSIDYGSDTDCNYNFCSNVLSIFSKGIPVFNEKKPTKQNKGWFKNDKPMFNHYNPRFFEWLKDKIPSPEVSVLGVDMQMIYDNVFQRFFHLMTESYLLLQNEYDIDDEIREYKYRAEKYEAIEFLYSNYSGVLTDYNYSSYEWNNDYEEGEYDEGGYDGYEENEEGYGEEEYYEEYDDGAYYGYQQYYISDFMSPADCMGFWLRRHIDGSSDKLWEVLQVFMKEYDPVWFDNLF